MKVQLVNLNGKNDSNFVVEEVNKFSSPKSFDMFDINIIDLRSEYIYRTHESLEDYINISYLHDFLTINEMIANSKKAKFIFIYPKNINFLTLYTFGQHKISKPIKDITSYVSKLFSILNKELDYKF